MITSYLSTALLFAGLAIAAGGAWITARAVIIDEATADDLASQRWDTNPQLKNALLDQSRKAKSGLIFICIGTLLQMAGTVVPPIADLAMSTRHEAASSSTTPAPIKLPKLDDAK